MAEIRIIGTAHVSQKSVDEVRTAIEEYTPEVVAIELDPSRYQALKRQAADPTVQDVLGVKNFNSLLVQWLLAYLQRKIGLDVGVAPSLTGTSGSRSCGSGTRWVSLKNSG